MSETAIRELEPVATFAAIARTLTESLELTEVLRRIASEVLALTQAQGVSVVMPRGELAEFVAHESPPPHSRIPVGYTFRPKPNLRAMLTGRRDPLVILNLHASPLIPADIKARIDARDLILIPLRVDDDLLGALIVGFNQLPEETTWDPSVLRAVGDQAAVAIRNAQLYEEARTATERLVQSEQLSALGRVVARVAHQLNNPLTTIRLIAESLELDALASGAREQVRALGLEVERAAMVVQDLLIFARKGRREFAPVDLGTAVRDAIDEQERRLAAAGIAVTTDIGRGLPPVHGDARALKQVLGNLLHNAGHALAEHDGERRILIRARADAAADRAEVAVEVEDSGPGVPPALGARIFEPFFTTKPLGEGTGLGLAIAREIVDVHDGTIEVGRASAGGAAFRIRLPAMLRPARPVADSMIPPARDAAHEPMRSLRVLVIEDETGLQRALGRVLRHLGCEVTAALSGDEGLDHARTREFDLVLCDIRVPGPSGAELFERLQAEAPRAAERIAFMTGDSLSEDIRSFLASTGRPALAKPFGRAQLVELLRTVEPGPA